MPVITIPNKLKPFLKPKRFKIAYGGRGAGKSQTFADMFLMKAQTESAKVGCFREMQNSIEDSVHSLLKDEISRLEVDGFTVEKASIHNQEGAEFKFKGLSRNPDAVKSMHGFKYFWVEEAQSISKDSLDKLTPTLREAGSEVWFSLNPQSSEDPVYNRFIKPFESELLRDGIYEDDLHTIVLVNYYDNPWFPQILEDERLWDYENKPRSQYDHIWLGKCNDSVEYSIIPVEWFDACIDSHIKMGFKAVGQKVVAFDPSDLGGDAKGLAVRHGSVFTEVTESTTGDVNEGCDWATDIAIKEQADLFSFDADGLGVTLRRQVSDAFEGKKITYTLFKGSESPDDPDRAYEEIGRNETQYQKKSNLDTFRNKRAQYYWKLRDRMYATYRAVEKKEYTDPDKMISISSDIKMLDKIRAELCRIPRKPTGNGLIQLVSKKDMKTSSPNMADAMMMSMSTLQTQKKWEKINYKRAR